MEIFKYSLSYNFLKHLYLSFKKNQSPVRLIHNYFLIGKKIKGITIDLGAGEGSNLSYYEYLDSISIFSNLTLAFVIALIYLGG